MRTEDDRKKGVNKWRLKELSDHYLELSNKKQVVTDMERGACEILTVLSADIYNVQDMSDIFWPPPSPSVGVPGGDDVVSDPTASSSTQRPAPQLQESRRSVADANMTDPSDVFDVFW